MKISATTRARIIALFDLNDLNPRGKVSWTRITPHIVARMGFTAFPTTLEQFDEGKGISFKDGSWDGIPIEQMTAYNDGIILDTLTNTSTSLEILRNALSWASEDLGLSISSRMFERVRFLSSFTFYSEVPDLLRSTPVAKLANRAAKELEDITGALRPYETVRLDLDFDHSEDKATIAPFTIQKRANTPFEENKYYTQAPLPTDVHIKLIEVFEADALSARR